MQSTEYIQSQRKQGKTETCPGCGKELSKKIKDIEQEHETYKPGNRIYRFCHTTCYLQHRKEFDEKTEYYPLNCRNCQRTYMGTYYGKPASNAENDLIYCSSACEEEDRKKEFPYANSGICLQI